MDELCELYIGVSRLVMEHMSKRRIPARVKARATRVRREPGKMFGEQFEELRNVLDVWDTLNAGVINLNELEPTLDRCADAIIALAGGSLPFWSVFPGPSFPFHCSGLDDGDYAINPRHWIRRSVLVPALRFHLGTLPSVDEASSDTARAFAEDIIRVCTSSDLRYQLGVPLSGLEFAAAAIQVGSACLRKLTPQEQGSILQQARSGIGESFINWPDVALEVVIAGPRAKQYLNGKDEISPFIAALQLHGFQISGQYFVLRSEPPWISFGPMYQPVSINKRSQESGQIKIDDFQAVVDTAHRLTGYHLQDPKSPRDLASMPRSLS